MNEVGDELRQPARAGRTGRARAAAADGGDERRVQRGPAAQPGDWRVRRSHARRQTRSSSASGCSRFRSLPRPSDRVLATRTAYRIDDLHQSVPRHRDRAPPAAVGAQRADVRRQRSDRRADGRQLDAGAVHRRRRADARRRRQPRGRRRAQRAASCLRSCRQAGMGGDLRRHQRSDRRVRSPRPDPARQPGAGAIRGSAGHGAARAELRRAGPVRRAVSVVRSRPGARTRLHQRGGHASGRADLPRHDLPDRRRDRRRRDRADRQGRDPGDPQRPPPADDERRTGRGERAAARDRRAAQSDPGAAAAGGEALRDWPAGGRRRARVEQSADQRHRLRAAPAGRGR